MRARIQTVEPLDQVAANVQKGLRIFVESESSIDSVAKRLDTRGDAEITLVLKLRDGGEADVRLRERYKISPQIAAAIKAVQGVAMVEML